MMVLWAWLSGDLPSRDAWYADHNHGPWRWEARGLAVSLSYLGLAFVPAGSFVHGLISATREGSISRVTPFVGASAFSVLLLFAVLSLFFWLID